MTKEMDIINYAKEVFDSEIEELKIVRDKINREIIDVVEEILKSEGKVVVTGIGKSGLIGKKNSCYTCFYRNTFSIHEFSRGASWRSWNDI